MIAPAGPGPAEETRGIRASALVCFKFVAVTVCAVSDARSIGAMNGIHVLSGSGQSEDCLPNPRVPRGFC